jgi:arginyl-tRNA synthetase
MPEHGDYACNYALTASKAIGKGPRDVATALVSKLEGNAAFEAIEIAGPGFINFRLTASFVGGFLAETIAKGVDYAKLPSTDKSQKINVEFVSVNPNGPITIGSGRGAAYGSTLCNVLEAAGNTIHREYYINDGVNSEQMRLFAESVRCMAVGVPIPEKGYRGDYVDQVAQTAIQMFERGFDAMIAYAQSNLDSTQDEVKRALFQRHLDCLLRLQALRQENDAVETIRKADLMDLKLICETLMTDAQSSALRDFGVVFDTWFSEQVLHDLGVVQAQLDKLIENGVADEEPYRTVVKFAKGGKVEEINKEPQTAEMEAEDSEGEQGEAQAPTLWLRSTLFGDDMDRVLRRRDGRPTYIASDVAYHQDKFNRPANADKLITILGPDHHGYIGRLTAVVAALLKRPDQSNDEALAEARQRLTVQIFQLVRFMKDGKPAPMRKRDGNIFALSDLVKEIGEKVKPNAEHEEQTQAGRDVARFFYLMRHHDTTFDFDLDLASKQSDENPVFYVQYAHARICSVIAKAEEAGLSGRDADVSLLGHAREKALICKIVDLPYEIARTAVDYGVHRLATYAVELARTYHHFYDACRVIQADEVELSRARLALCEGTKIALQAVCGLLGVSTPERMERES